MIADDGRAFFLDSTQPDHDAVANPAIVTELGVSAYDNSAKMINDEVATNPNFARQLYSRDDLDEFEQHPIDQREEFPQQGGPDAVTPTAEAIDHHHPETLGTPISLMRSKIITDVVKHRRLPGFAIRECVAGHRVGRAASLVVPSILTIIEMCPNALLAPLRSNRRRRLLSALNRSALTESATPATSPRNP